MTSYLYVIGSRLPLLVDKKMLTLLVSIYTEVYTSTKRERSLSFHQADCSVMSCRDSSQWNEAKRFQYYVRHPHFCE